MNTIFILILMNMLRGDANLKPLILNDALSSVAAAKCADMTANNTFSHDMINGRMNLKFFNGRYSPSYAGENLAENFATEWDQNEGWRNSPVHYANIMFPKFTEVGIAVCGNKTAIEFANPAGK